MLYLLISLSIFFCSVIAHVTWCRIRRRQTLAIIPFIIFSSIGLGIYGMAAKAWINASAISVYNLWNAPIVLTGGMLYILLIPVYLIFYFGTKVESPSRRIVLLLEEYDSLHLNDLLRHMTDENLVMPRLRDLERCHYVQCDQGEYRLTMRGVDLAKKLNSFQRFLGRGMGG